MVMKSYEKMVKEIYPNSTYVRMSTGILKVHTIYNTGEWKEIIGQSMYSKKDAWRDAYNRIQMMNKAK